MYFNIYNNYKWDYSHVMEGSCVTSATVALSFRSLVLVISCGRKTFQIKMHVIQI